MNYNIACKTHHEGTAAWFFQGTVFKDWTSIGSLLWIHGKRTLLLSQLLATSIDSLQIVQRDLGRASFGRLFPYLNQPQGLIVIIAR